MATLLEFALLGIVLAAIALMIGGPVYTARNVRTRQKAEIEAENQTETAPDGAESDEK